jgi:hypothetical protein
MSPTAERAPFRWHLSAAAIWALGIPHFFPLLGVYAMLGGNSRDALLLLQGALFATGCFAGFIQALIVSRWALLITPVTFYLGYSPGARFIFGGKTLSEASFGTAILLTLVTSILAVTAGQWLLSRVSHRSEPGD